MRISSRLGVVDIRINSSCSFVALFSGRGCFRALLLAAALRPDDSYIIKGGRVFFCKKPSG